MSNSPFDQKLKFDIQLTVTAPFTGTAQLVGVLTNEPVVIVIQNNSTVPVFFADNNGSTNGITLQAGQVLEFSNRGNNGRAVNMGFPIGTTFFVTGTAGTGTFNVAIIYAN